MNRLDKISTVAIAGIVLWMLVLAVVQLGQDEDSGDGSRPPTALRGNPVLDQKIDLARRRLDDKLLDQADQVLTELVATYPLEAMPYLLKGDLYRQRQDVIAAMLAYRKAVELNPEILERDRDLVQGRGIKKTVEEAGAAIETGLAAKPGDPSLLEARKGYQYMMRWISCSGGEAARRR